MNDINLRSRADMNSSSLGIYRKNAIVEVIATEIGEEYDQIEEWYKLDNGGFLWSGGVNVHISSYDLPDKERQQFFLCYREVDRDGRPREELKGVPNELTCNTIQIPADEESIRVYPWDSKTFASRVMASVNALNDDNRKHVFVYIPGWQLQMLSSLKTDLLSNFVLSYMTHPQNTIAKVIFMSWPSQSGPKRETVDDRSVEAGRHFTDHNMFDYFRELSEALDRQGKFLNLIVHSFGHQLLNGMVNPNKVKVPAKIFKNIFLMAPDIAHRSAKQGGVEVDNRFSSNNNSTITYDLSKLKDLAGKVHVFNDQFDFLLYFSTRNFNGRNNPYDEKTKQFRNLGNYGNSCYEATDATEPNFNFEDIEKIVSSGVAGDLWDFPYRPVKGTRFGSDILDVLNNNDYSGITPWKIFTHKILFENHHRYLFTCKAMVDRVMALLNSP